MTREEEAIQTITSETGYPPTPDELAAALGISVKSLHSRLTPLKRSGRVGYDEEERFICRSPLRGVNE